MNVAERVAAAEILPIDRPPGGDLAAILATPYLWRGGAAIPQRPWIYGRWFLRHTVTAVVAPGGLGKSALMVSTALALASGRALLGKTVWDRRQRVWYWNLEDDADELARIIEAAALHHCVEPHECVDALFVDSAMEGAQLCMAIEGETGCTIVRPVVEGLVLELKARQIDVLIVDPFVSSHAVDENRNGPIDMIAKEWGRVAKRADCAIVLVHHTRKLAGLKVTAEASRGAGSLINATRSALVLNRMDSEEADRFQIEGDQQRRRYFSVQDDKHNRAPAESADWYRMASVELGNGDNVGVVERWAPPDPFDGVRPDHLYRVQMAIAEGDWKESVQAADWAGKAVAQVMGWDLSDKAEKKRISQMLRTWIHNGALKSVRRMDSKKREEKPFVEVGEWAINPSAPP